MKHVRIETLRFVGFESFTLFGRESKTLLSDPNALNKFLVQVDTELKSVMANRKFIYGQRVERMFAALVISLGRVQFLKQEDAGECYANVSPLEIPDFRLRLSNETSLVEVKNHHPKGDATRGLRLRQSYLEGLENYAKLMSCPLWMAVYWSRWGLWTLVPPTLFRRDGKHAHLAMTEAFVGNELYRLGNIEIGTTPPLRMVWHVSQLGDASPSENGRTTTLRIDRAELFCGNALLVDRAEQTIAFYLMCYGSWRMRNEAKRDGGKIVAIEYEWKPEQESAQGFEFIGSLASMFSRFYIAATTDLENGAVARVNLDVTPGDLGHLIPEEYTSRTLPLWRLHIVPKGVDLGPDANNFADNRCQF